MEVHGQMDAHWQMEVLANESAPERRGCALSAATNCGVGISLLPEDWADHATELMAQRATLLLG